MGILTTGDVKGARDEKSRAAGMGLKLGGLWLISCNGIVACQAIQMTGYAGIQFFYNFYTSQIKGCIIAITRFSHSFINRNVESALLPRAIKRIALTSETIKGAEYQMPS